MALTVALEGENVFEQDREFLKERACEEINFKYFVTGDVDKERLITF